MVFPVHPRTAKTLRDADASCRDELRLVEPQPYLEFNYLVQHAKAVITDSGGITEETTVMGVPCLTLRDTTERPETVTIGTNELIGTDPARLAPALDRLFGGTVETGRNPGEVGWPQRRSASCAALERLLCALTDYACPLLAHAAPSAAGAGLWPAVVPAVPAASRFRPAPPLRVSAGPWITPPAGEPRLLGPATLPLPQSDPHPRRGRRLEPARTRDKLWLYNLHYFDDLNAERREQRRGLAPRPDRALDRRQPARSRQRLGAVSALAAHRELGQVGAGRKRAGTGLDAQPGGSGALASRAAWSATCSATTCSPTPRRWSSPDCSSTVPKPSAGLHAGLHILDRAVAGANPFRWRPLRTQPDVPRALFCKDLLDLLNLAAFTDPSSTGRRGAQSSSPPWLRRGGAQRRGGSIPIADWRRVAQTMLDWLKMMTHPDGEIAFFNDAAFGIAPTLAQLADYAERLGHSFRLWSIAFNLTPHRLPDSGYLRLQAGAAVLILDAGPIGPDYLPGHAHADTLSFELSLFGRRVIVNSGTSCYGTSPERQRQRGTAAHNTVVVDDQDSSEVWGGFRVARRARPLNLRWGETADGGWVECAHDGYQRLPGRVTHGRRWVLNPTSLRLEDRLDGRYQNAVVRLHLHPAIRAGLDNMAKGWLELPSGQRLCWDIEGGCARLIPSTWHPHFGVSAANVCLEILFNGSEVNLVIEW